MNKYNTFWPRFWALFIDGIIFQLILKLVELIDTSNSQILFVLISFISLNIPYIYSILLHGKYGQTLGKMLLNIKIIDFKSEEKINYNQALVRDSIPLILVNLFFIIAQIITWGQDMTNYSFTTLGYIVLLTPAFMIFIWSILEIVTMLFDSYNRALHDKIAKTVVIRIKEKK